MDLCLEVETGSQNLWVPSGSLISGLQVQPQADTLESQLSAPWAQDQYAGPPQWCSTATVSGKKRILPLLCIYAHRAAAAGLGTKSRPVPAKRMELSCNTVCRVQGPWQKTAKKKEKKKLFSAFAVLWEK